MHTRARAGMHCRASFIVFLFCRHNLHPNSIALGNPDFYTELAQSVSVLVALTGALVFSCSVGFYTLMLLTGRPPRSTPDNSSQAFAPVGDARSSVQLFSPSFEVIYKPPSRIMVHIQNIPNRLHPVGIVFIRAFTELPRLCCSVVRCCCTSLFSCCFFC